MTTTRSKSNITISTGSRPVYFQRRQHKVLLSFVAGVVIGLALSVVVLVRPNSESVTNNVYINIGEQRHAFKLDPRFAEFDHLLEQLHPYAEITRELSEEVSFKDPVYYAVVVRNGRSLNNLKAVQSTWAKDIPSSNVGFFVPFEKTPPGNFKVEDPTKLNDGSYKDNIIQLSRSGVLEIQTLKFLCKYKLNDTKWFFISSDDVYVKTNMLESFLSSLEASQDQLRYLGKPIDRDLVGGACMPGPGSILSQSTLSELCPEIGTCSKLRGNLETECVVGECVRKQLPSVQCAKEGNPHELFLEFNGGKEGSIVDPRNKQALDTSLTVYPITDPRLMFSVHQLIVSRRLNDSQHEIQQLKLTLDHMAELLPHADTNLQQENENRDVLKSEDDIVSWKLINHDKLMSCVGNNPASKIQTLWKEELGVLSSKAMKYLNSHNKDLYTFKRMVNVYLRVDPLLGTEYILDFEVKLAGTESNYSIPSKPFRAALTRLFNDPESNPVTPELRAPRHISIGILVTRDHMQRLKKFMSMMERVLEKNQNIDLIVVEMRSKTEKQKKLKTFNPKSIVAMYRNKYPQANFKLIDSAKQLSRSHGISLIVPELKPDDLLLISDIDFEFDNGFLQRCQNYPILGQQAFFPIPFYKMDPSLVMSMNHTAIENDITQHSGHWLVDSYSTACIHAADILSNVQREDLKTTPNEINMTEVYSTLIQKGYEIIRGADKGLKKLHSKERPCELDVYGERHDHCNSPKNFYEKLYLKTQVSTLLLDHEGEHAHKKY